MRADAPLALAALGFQADVDFRATVDGTGLHILWLSALPQPSEAEIDAVDLSPAAVLVRLNTTERSGATVALGGNRTALWKTLRGTLSVVVSEVNVILAALPRPMSSITRSGTVATATTPTAHGLSNGTIAVFGADVAAYNGVKTITVTGATTFTFTVAGSPATPALGTLLYVLDASAPPISRALVQAINAINVAINSGIVD